MATKLPRVINSIEDLPEALREPLRDAYGAGTGDHAGKFVLLGTDPDVERLQGALTNERNQRAKAVTDLAAAGKQVDTLTADLAKSKKPPKDPGDESELMQQFDSFKTASNSRIKVLEDQVRAERDARVGAEGTMREGQLLTDLHTASIAGGASEAAAPDVVSRMHRIIKEKDGKYVPTTKTGDVLLGKVKDPTQPMAWEELARGIVTESPHLGRQNRGGGSGGGAGGGEGSPSFTITQTEAKDPAIYRAKKAEAAKAGRELEIASDR